jgi:CRISPR-associated protein Cas2
MIYLVCYDICEPKRLKRVAKTLERFGIRIQYSFFQVDAPNEVVVKMKNEVLEIIDKSEDRFFIYPLCGRCTRSAVTDGTGKLIRLEAFEII